MSSKKARWEDSTSYSQGERRGTTTPRSWSLGTYHRSGINIHRLHGDPDSWYLTCYDLGIEKREMTNVGLEEVKAEALICVRKELQSMVAYYKKLGVPL